MLSALLTGVNRAYPYAKGLLVRTCNVALLLFYVCSWPRVVSGAVSK